MFIQIEQDLKLLEINLNKMAGPKHPVLYAATEHLFHAGGKRIRPSLLLLVAKATNTNGQLTDKHRRLAEIIEIIHTASLLHDDVIDDCSQRRGSGTVNSKFSNKIAVLAGDFLFAQSSWYLANLNNLDVVKIISKIITDFAEGEVQQASTNFDTSVSIDSYINKSFHKTASLIAYSCKAAAILNNTNVETQQQFYNYGKHLGLAFQIIDDILDINGTDNIMGKAPGSDLKNGNLTAPLLFSLEKSSKLYTLIEREFEQPNDIKETINLIRSSQGINKAKDLAIEHIQTAIQSLKNLNFYNDSIEDLISISDYIINRVK